MCSTPNWIYICTYWHMLQHRYAEHQHLEHIELQLIYISEIEHTYPYSHIGWFSRITTQNIQVRNKPNFRRLDVENQIWTYICSYLRIVQHHHPEHRNPYHKKPQMIWFFRLHHIYTCSQIGTTGHITTQKISILNTPNFNRHKFSKPNTNVTCA